MKRHGNIYPQIIDFANILTAARKAQKGKRFRSNVLAFNYKLESELINIQHELRDKTYQPGAYRTFYIKEPKTRMISAAPYPDRVVHHALCNIILPIIEPTFIIDSYANRVGFGTHKALKRFTNFARSSRYVSFVETTRWVVSAPQCFDYKQTNPNISSTPILASVPPTVVSTSA